MNFRLLILGGVALATCGCSTPKLNTGAVDYRQQDSVTSTPDVDKSAQPTPAPSDEKAPAAFMQSRYFQPSELESLSILKPNESVSIRLLQVYICDFSEDSFWEYFKRLRPGEQPGCNPDGDSHPDTQGEIAVIADAFEQGDKRIEFSTGTASAEKGRVVYYGEDVRETGQFLNLSNIPLYGPITYTGKPLFLRLTIVELDDLENSQLSATLKTLAGLGSKAYPPGSEVLGVLNGLGEAFLSGSQDDLEFDYVMSFDGSGGQSTNYAPLAVGMYTFVRMENRDTSFKWKNVEIDRKTGRLVCTADGLADQSFRGCELPRGKSSTATTGESDKPERVEFRGETYFTIKVVKNEPAIENESVQLLSEFKKQAEQDIQARSFETLETIANKLSEEAKVDTRFDKARSELVTLRSDQSNDVECSLALEAAIDGICSLLVTDRVNDAGAGDDGDEAGADGESGEYSDATTKNLDRARYLLSELYDIAQSSKNGGSGCSSVVGSTNVNVNLFTINNARTQCDSENGQRAQFLGLREASTDEEGGEGSDGEDEETE